MVEQKELCLPIDPQFKHDALGVGSHGCLGQVQVGTDVTWTLELKEPGDDLLSAQFRPKADAIRCAPSTSSNCGTMINAFHLAMRRCGPDLGEGKLLALRRERHGCVQPNLARPRNQRLPNCLPQTLGNRCAGPCEPATIHPDKFALCQQRSSTAIDFMNMQTLQTLMSAMVSTPYALPFTHSRPRCGSVCGRKHSHIFFDAMWLRKATRQCGFQLPLTAAGRRSPRSR